jgi:hydrogenase expression/formation protein HypC
MCLGVPGEVLDIDEPTEGLPQGTVSFGGIRKRVCLAYAPEAKVGDYVVVHAGFALSVIDPERARAVFETLGGGHEVP